MLSFTLETADSLPRNPLSHQQQGFILHIDNSLEGQQRGTEGT